MAITNINSVCDDELNLFIANMMTSIFYSFIIEINSKIRKKLYSFILSNLKQIT